MIRTYLANSSRGSAIVSALLVVVGLMLGAALLAVLRMSNIDVLGKIAPKIEADKEKVAAAEAPAPITWFIPQEKEVIERLAKIKDVETKQEAREKKVAYQ